MSGSKSFLFRLDPRHQVIKAYNVLFENGKKLCSIYKFFLNPIALRMTKNSIEFGLLSIKQLKEVFPLICSRFFSI